MSETHNKTIKGTIMQRILRILAAAIALAGASALGACATPPHAAPDAPGAERHDAKQEAAARKFAADRAAILAMAGEFNVTFDFTETAALIEGYEPKPRYKTGGHEIVRIIEDRGDFLSLQHILVADSGGEFAIKHWRQDWIYEPQEILVFIGGAAWEKRGVAPDEARGKWAQIVYQVDDAPRYGALGAWRHEAGISQWEPPRELRPLPRRDATKRDDYQAIAAINRHTITPDGWLHEQDNTKLILKGGSAALAREIGINTYKRTDDIDAGVAEDYWAATADFWAGIRAEWRRYERENVSFGLTIQGEPEALYNKILGLADAVKEEGKPTAEALIEARQIIAEYTTTQIGDLEDRLDETTDKRD